MKKAQSQYISWILILVLVVTLSAILYTWSIKQAETTTEDLIERSDPVHCSEIGFSVDSICQNFRGVKVNISNTNNQQINGFLFHMVGLYPDDPDYLYTTTLYEVIDPNDKQKIEVLKKNTLSQIELIPIIQKDSKNIICEDYAVTIDQQSLKYCSS